MVADVETNVGEGVQTEGQASSTESSAGSGDDNESKASRAAKYINFPKDSPLWERLESEATAAGKTPRQLVFELLAGRYGVEVPATVATAPRKKYASDEERAAAQKAARKDRNELIKQLLAEHAAKQAQLAQASAQATA